MSSIDKMAIKGIRSFDNNQTETIQFYSPLTLIVGYNGSGKTTIIECLKYATMGGMPPNTKGGAFIHDPQMCGEREVLAQVKLSFDNLHGEKMICTRSLQLTVKKTAHSVRSLDGTLTIMKNGERSTISTRCADMDAQIPLSLGVSRAILEYVIFCHQEESTWPLLEPGVLKKRFDEIFEALKYTNALDQIKSIRKSQVVQVKIDSETLERFRGDKERAAKVQNDADEVHDKIERSRARVKSLDEQMSLALIEQNQLFTSGQEFERILADLSKFRHEKSILHDTLKDLSKNVEEYVETDEELEDMKANFTINTAKSEQAIETLRAQERDAKDKLASARHALELGMSEEGRMRSEAENYENQLKKREDTIRSISRTLNIRGYDMTLDNEQIAEFKARVDSLVKSQALKVESLRQDGRSKEAEINRELQTIQAQLSEHESRKNSARAQIQSTESKLGSLQSKFDRDTGEEADATNLEEELKVIEGQLSNAQTEMDATAWDSHIREKNAKSRENEERIRTVNQEVNQGNRQADTRAKLGLLKSSLKSKQDILQHLIRSNNATFVDITGNELRPQSMETDLRLKISTNDREIEEFTNNCQIASKEVSHIEAQISVNKESMSRKRKEEVVAKDQILETVDSITDIDDQISDLEAQLEHAQSVFHQSRFASKFYENAIKFANQKNCCQLCAQTFDDDYTLEDFTNTVEARKAAVPRSLAAAKENIDILTSDISSAKAILPVRDRLASLQAEIRQLDATIKEQQISLANAVGRADIASIELQNSTAISKNCLVLDRAVTEVSRAQREANDLSRQITNLEAELLSSGSIRSVDDMQAELSMMQEQNRQFHKDISQIMIDKDVAKGRIASLDSRRRDTQLALSELHGRIRDKQHTQIRLEEHRESIKKWNELILAAQTQIALLQPDVARLRSDLETIQQKNNDAEVSAQRDTSRLVASQNTLLHADADIDDYLRKGKPDALRQSLLGMIILKQSVSEAEQALISVSESITHRQTQNANLKTAERNIDDNLRLRRVKNDMAKIEDKIQVLVGRNAERDRQRYIADSERMKLKYSKLVTERASLLGEITQMDTQFQGFQKQLMNEYKNAAEVYRKHLIKVRTMEKANEDLEKYGKALDNAIMKYHSLKMEEINKIIDELWKGTYCGTDVDTILIKSEGENKVANRSYNYRVCMVKGEAELDMRGRCSAGQKVLAAIIIRLALAECFGVNCGILALDEPTTNLDRENIESLAKSLANIISVRRAQKNFQLIVITHDEEFLRMMGCSDYCDYYYRVSRNEHQKSIIERQRVSTVL